MATLAALKPHLKQALLVAAIFVVLAAALPFLGVAALATRFAILIVVPLAVAALVFSPSLRAWLAAGAGDEAFSYKGLALASDVVLHPAHAWARQRGRRVRVGADDLLQRALGPVERIDVPVEGRRVRQGDPLFLLRRGDRSVAVRSPVTGTVERTNPLVVREPQRVNRSPYAGGWTVELWPDDFGSDAARLRRREPAQSWFRTEVDRFVAALSPVPGVAVAQEGGDLVADVHRLLDDEAWVRVSAAFFGDEAPSS
jgi:glycine cleavage system H lipoate-binding protein